jgi:hypothetical protein
VTKDARNDPMEEPPRHRRKRKRRHIRSDHKHEYETVCVDDGSYVIERGVRRPRYCVAERCAVCGRVGDLRLTSYEELPDGMPLYEVNDWMELWRERYLPKSAEVRRDEADD